MFPVYCTSVAGSQLTALTGSAVKDFSLMQKFNEEIAGESCQAVSAQRSGAQGPARCLRARWKTSRLLGNTFLPDRIIQRAQAVRCRGFLSIKSQRERPASARTYPVRGGCSVGASGCKTPPCLATFPGGAAPKSGRSSHQHGKPVCSLSA